MKTYEEVVKDLAIDFLEGLRIANLLSGDSRPLNESFEASMDAVFENVDLMRPEDAQIIQQNRDIIKRDVYKKIKEMTKDDEI